MITHGINIAIKNLDLHSKETGKKGKVHPCTGTEALYRPYGP